MRNVNEILRRAGKLKPGTSIPDDSPDVDMSVFANYEKYEALIDSAQDSVSLERIQNSLCDIRQNINKELAKFNTWLGGPNGKRSVRTRVVERKDFVVSHLQNLKRILRHCSEKRDDVKRSERPFRAAQAQLLYDGKELLYKTYVVLDNMYQRGISFSRGEKDVLDKLRNYIVSM